MEYKEKKRNYLLRNIDEKLWKQVKIYAAQQEISIKTLILNLLKQRINNEK